MPRMPLSSLCRSILLSVLVFSALPLAYGGRVWFDGTVDDENAPPGKLLSDNEDYWGEVILTGVEYRYEVEPDKPADNRPNRAGGTGRTLLNGNQGRARIGEVGLSGDRPLVVVFDFKRPCTFTEWDLIAPSSQVSIRLDLRNADDEPWSTVYDRERDACPDQEFHRLVLADTPSGRFARLTVQGAGITRLREVIAWGNATLDEAHPEAIAPVAQGQYPVGIAYPTLTGVAGSAISDREAFYWVQALDAKHRQQPAVWFRVPTWDAISHRPLAPLPGDINQPIHIRMTRNETEAIAVALKNTLVDGVRSVKVSLAPLALPDGRPATGIAGTLGIFGVIGDRAFGNGVGPIFEADNLLGGSLMEKYLLNGKEIRTFPAIDLPPSGAAVCWLSIRSDGAAPGTYHSSLEIEGGERVPVTVEVLDVTLPQVFAHVKTYSTNRTRQFPFEYADRAARDIAYGLDSGISDWGRVPERDTELLNSMAADRGMRLLSSLGHLVPSKYVHNVYVGKWTSQADFPENAAQEIADHVHAMVAGAKERGLDYADWYGSTGDEPSAKNIGGVAAMVRLIKAADPRVNVYINPCYWTGFDRGGAAQDDVVAPGLDGWYNELVDISMPLFLLLRDRPRSWQAFSAPRLVNSYYYVSGHLDRSEDAKEVQKYRRMAWDSVNWGFNGWAFYSWYSPRANAWNHFDRNPPGEGLREPNDYQMVYPGPRGVIRTRHSEALREGWEDWRLLHLLKQRGNDAEVAELLQAYREGAEPYALRQRALDAIMK